MFLLQQNPRANINKSWILADGEAKDKQPDIQRSHYRRFISATRRAEKRYVQYPGDGHDKKYSITRTV